MQGGTARWAALSLSLVPDPGISQPAGKTQHPDCLLTWQLSSMPPPGREVFQTVFSLVTLGLVFFLPRKEDNQHNGSVVLNVTSETSSSCSLPETLMGSGSQGPAQGESSTCPPCPLPPQSRGNTRPGGHVTSGTQRTWAHATAGLLGSWLSRGDCPPSLGLSVLI